jgi:uncharacterized protein YbjT (DUF2867 family)
MAFGFPIRDHKYRKTRILGDGKQRVGYIALSDVARFASACVNDPGKRDRTIEPDGPRTLTPVEAVALFERVTGDKYDLEYLPAETIRAQYEGATHPAQKPFAWLMLGVTTDEVIPMSDTAREFGLEHVTVEEFAPRLVVATVVP